MPTLDNLDTDHQPAPHRHTGRLPTAVVQEGPRGRLVALVDEYSGAWMTARELTEVEP